MLEHSVCKNQWLLIQSEETTPEKDDFSAAKMFILQMHLPHHQNSANLHIRIMFSII